MHDGSLIRLRKIAPDWDPLNRLSAINAVQNAKLDGEILTGLLFINPDSVDLHTTLETASKPLNSLTSADLCPGASALEGINSSLR
jgi:2-oxoglutarate ferredoxin oxidoreductase subunit beta